MKSSRFHIEMRTRELVERGMDPKTARETRAVAHRRPRAAQTDLRGPGQKARTRDAADSVARRPQRRCGGRAAAAEGVAGIRPRRRADARTRHRRQQRDVRRRRRDAAAAAALSRCRSPGDRVGDQTERTARRRQPARLRRLERAQPHVRRDGRRDERSIIDHRRATVSPNRWRRKRSRAGSSTCLASDRSPAAHFSPATRDDDPMWSCCPKDCGEAISARDPTLVGRSVRLGGRTLTRHRRRSRRRSSSTSLDFPAWDRARRGPC